MDWMTDEELIAAYEERAADCARNASEARKRKRAASAACDREEVYFQDKIARNWSNQAAQLRRDAWDLRKSTGEKPPVEIKGRGGKAKGSTPPRPF